MPTYAYRCNACLFEWEREHKITDPPDTVCPYDSDHEPWYMSSRVVRLLFPVATVFKGEGWTPRG